MGRSWGGTLVVAVLAACFLGAVSCDAAEQVVRLSNQSVIDFDTMIAEVKGASLVFVGETHAQEAHHVSQLRIIHALHQSGRPLAIGLEMFTAENQRDLDLWVAGYLDEQNFISRYARNWTLPWSLYRPIFLYARDNRIPLIGLNIPREIVQKVARGGYAALTPADKESLPTGIRCRVDSAYMAFIKKVFAEHTGTDGSFLHFCEAQMVWTKSMGRRLLSFLKSYPGQLVVVLTGAGHAVKQGIPSEVEENSPFGYKVIVPQIAGLDRTGLTSADADYIVIPR